MKKQKCDWCGKNFPSTREHSIEDCSGQIEWGDWLDELESSRFDFY